MSREREEREEREREESEREREREREREIVCKQLEVSTMATNLAQDSDEVRPAPDEVDVIESFLCQLREHCRDYMLQEERTG